MTRTRLARWVALALFALACLGGAPASSAQAARLTPVQLSSDPGGGGTTGG